MKAQTITSKRTSKAIPIEVLLLVKAQTITSKRTSIGIAFDFWKSSDAVCVSNLAHDLTMRMIHESSAFPRKPAKPSKLIDTTVCVLMNMLNLAKVHSRAYIFYSRSRNHYSGKAVSHDHMMRVVRGLKDLGLIDTRDGAWSPVNTKSRRSCIRPTVALLNLFEEYQIQFHHICVASRFELIVMKDSDKNQIPLPQSRRARTRINKMRRNLEKINEQIGQTFIGLNVDDETLETTSLLLSQERKKNAIDFSRKTLYRVFNNGDLNQGGRFYGGWWQNIPSELRKEIIFGYASEKKPLYTREVDFRSMQPAIAYAKSGIPMPSQMYRLDLPAGCRNIAKKTLLAMLNTSSKRSVPPAVYKALREEAENGETTAEELLPDGCPRIPEVVDCLEQRHSPIADWFYSKRGLELMAIEAEIAETTMVMLADEEITALPIHDSFIVASGHKVVLRDAMLEAFKIVTGHECRVSMEGRGSRNAWAAKQSTCRSLYKAWRKFALQ